MTGIRGIDLVKKFESFAPKELAEDGDPVGLAIGTLDQPVKKIMVTLDVRPEVVQEAIEKNIDFIFAHHPPIFRPIKQLKTDDPQIKMYADLLKHKITVYAAHTNLDVVPDGINKWLADAVELKDTELLHITKSVYYKKIAVFVPKEQADAVRKALNLAGAGSIGPNYKNCTYTLEGTGRFTPIHLATPAIGSKNHEELVTEERIEAVFPEYLTAKVLKEVLAVHPYEEPAYDIYTVENYADHYGLGRVGNLAEAVKVKDFVQKIKEIFGVEGLRYITDDETKWIQRVAVCGGDGGSFYPYALEKGADVYITGDVYYHTGHDMLADGLTVIDPGHHIESICKSSLQQLFTAWSEELEWPVEIVQSGINTDPYRFL